MRRLLTALHQGWRSLREPAKPGVPFAVPCVCGRLVQGMRGARSQVLRCPGCAAPLFVLPRSPLPPGDDEDVPSTPPPSVRSPWRLPFVAALATLVVVAGGLVVFFSILSPPRNDKETDAGRGETPPIAEVIESSRKLLREGGFHEAARLLQEARNRGERHPDLIQLQRQARLLGKLLHLSLQEIIQKGQLVRQQPEEWQTQLKDYRGRSVLFDAVVRRDADGSCQLLNYEVIVAEEKAILKLDLDLLRQVPLGEPRRLIFGAALANVSRGAGGIWEIEFERDSGVLLTDEEAAAGLVLQVDDGLREVLREQSTWPRPRSE